MPFKSQAQQKFMFANKKALEKKGVDVQEWADATDYSKLPKKASGVGRKRTHG
jgi:GH25 family lysozyme M1 (1,4-beta-N-acetylmuramidase)